MSCIPSINAKSTDVADAAASTDSIPFSSPQQTGNKDMRLISMSKNANKKIRDAVAGNPNTPTWVLWELSKDEEPSVRSWVARNSSSPDELVSFIAAWDADPSIRAFAAWRLDLLVNT